VRFPQPMCCGIIAFFWVIPVALFITARQPDYLFEKGRRRRPENHPGSRPGNGSRGDRVRDLQMDYLGESVPDFHGECRRESEKDLRASACGDWLFDLPAELHRGSEVELRRDLQRGLQKDCRGDSDGALRAEFAGGCARELRIRGECVSGTDMTEGQRLRRVGEVCQVPCLPPSPSLPQPSPCHDFPCPDHAYPVYFLDLEFVIVGRRSGPNPGRRLSSGRSAAACIAF